MSKYANLPDIDTAPDTYQIDSPPLSPTNSAPGSGSGSDVEANGSDSQQKATDADRQATGTIRRDGIDSKIASERFRKATQLRADQLDYSDSIQPRHKKPPTLSRSQLLPAIYGVESSIYSSDPNLQDAAYQNLDPTLNTSSSGNKETPAEKLNRLRRETDLLEQELSENQDHKATSSTTDPESASSDALQVLHQLKALQNRLNGDLSRIEISNNQEGMGQGEVEEKWQKDARAILSNLSSTSSFNENQNSKSNDSDVKEDPQTSIQKTKDLALLDSRISGIEDLVGVKDILTGVDESSPLPKPILPTLTKLEHQLLLLTQPRHLDAISRRVKVLASELNRVHEARKRLGEEIVVSNSNNKASDTNSKDPNSNPNLRADSLLSDPSTISRLNALSKLQPRLEELLPLAPSLLTRLRSLSNLHESSNNFHVNLEKLDGRLKNQHERNSEMTQVLENVEQSLKENRKMVDGNLKGIEERLEDLGKRLKDLSN